MQNSQRCFLQLGTDPVSRAGSVPYGATSEKLATALWETQDMSLAASRFGEEGHAEREKRFSQIGIATWNEVSGCHSLTINANHIGGWPIFVGYFVFTVFFPVELGFLGSDLFCNFGPHGSAGHTFPGFKRWILVRNGITAETLAQSTLNETSQFEICSRKRFELVDPLRFGLFMMWRLLQRVENLAWMMEQYWICSDCPNRKCYNKWPGEGWQQRYGLDYVNQQVFFHAFWCVLTISCLQCTPSCHCHFRCLSGKTSTTHRFAPLLLRCRCTYRSNTLATTRIVAANPWRGFHSKDFAVPWRLSFFTMNEALGFGCFSSNKWRSQTVLNCCYILMPVCCSMEKTKNFFSSLSETICGWKRLESDLFRAIRIDLCS